MRIKQNMQIGLMAGCLALGLAQRSDAQSSVTIDGTKQYQTMDGFGCAVSTWMLEHHNDAAFMNTLVNDLGMSILRVFPVPSFEATNENTDATSLDLTRFSIAGSVGTQMQVVNKAKAAGLSRVFLTFFTPPAWMKQGPYYAGFCSDGVNMCGGSLRPDMYGEYAEFVSAYVKMVKQQCQIDVMAVSPQNEPKFEEPYESCVYSAVQMRDVIKAIGGRFVSEGMNTPIMLPEEVLSDWMSLRGYITTACGDTVANKYISICAFHGYAANGITPNSSDVRQIQSFGNLATQYKKRGWMSETSGYSADWSGAMTLAQSILLSIKYGRLSAWVFLQPSHAASDAAHINQALTIDKQPTARYWVSKNFYRYIRPGAIQVDCLTPDTTVAIVAFGHREDKTLTVVAINNQTAAKTVTLGGNGLPATYKLYRTSSSENCVDKGVVSGSGITLPAGSVTTLVAAGYQMPTVGVSGGTNGGLGGIARPVRVNPAKGGGVFSLQGRLLRRAQNMQVEVVSKNGMLCRRLGGR